MLGFDANYAGGHYEMGMVKVQTGEAGTARPELQKAIELWKNADPDLDELRQARQHLATLEDVARRWRPFANNGLRALAVPELFPSGTAKTGQNPPPGRAPKDYDTDILRKAAFPETELLELNPKHVSSQRPL
jgi:hypothetical protein